jgi:hypothetical protein
MRSGVAVVEPQRLLHSPHAGAVEVTHQVHRHRVQVLQVVAWRGRQPCVGRLGVDARVPKEPDGVDVFEGQPRLGQAPPHRARRERAVVLDAGEALLLDGADDATVHDQGRRGVIREIDAEDLHAADSNPSSRPCLRLLAGGRDGAGAHFAAATSESRLSSSGKGCSGASGLPGRTDTHVSIPAALAAHASSRLSVTNTRSRGARPSASAIFR